jgi:hypothetical protein
MTRFDGPGIRVDAKAVIHHARVRMRMNEDLDSITQRTLEHYERNAQPVFRWHHRPRRQPEHRALLGAIEARRRSPSSTSAAAPGAT